MNCCSCMASLFQHVMFVWHILVAFKKVWVLNCCRFKAICWGDLYKRTSVVVVNDIIYWGNQWWFMCWKDLWRRTDHCFQQNRIFNLEKETVFHVALPVVIVKRTEISNGEQTNRARFCVCSAASTVCSYTGVNACFLSNHTLCFMIWWSQFYIMFFWTVFQKLCAIKVIKFSQKYTKLL